MFYDCEELKYLDISSFNTTKVNNMRKLFEQTKILIYLNLLNFYIFNSTDVNNILSQINPDVILCYNESRVSDNFTYEARNF